MARQPKCYEYEQGRFIAYLRVVGGHSLGISVPKSVAQTYRLRPGMKVMVDLKPVAEAKDEEGERWTRSGRRNGCASPWACWSCSCPCG